MPEDRKQRKADGPDPMAEENFPDNPTRRAADKHMAEAPNTPGSNPEARKAGRRANLEDDDKDEAAGRQF